MPDQGSTSLNNSHTGIHVRRPSIINNENDSSDSSASPLLQQSKRASPELLDMGKYNLEEEDNEEHKLKTGPLKKASLITENTLHVLLAILGWYAFSLTISLYNKWMFDKTKLNFPFPILITSFHQLLLSMLSFITLRLKPSLNSSSPTLRPQNIQQTWRFYFTHIIPCALASAGDIGAGNASFRFISLTTYTMVKSSSIAFVLLFGVLTKLEKFSYHLLGIVLLMTLGVMLMVDKSSQSDNPTDEYYTLGFLLVLLSSCMSGLRWVFTQLLLHKNSNIVNDIQQSEINEDQSSASPTPSSKASKNPVYTIYQLSPPMFLILFIIGLFVEGFGSFLKAEIWEQKGLFKGCLLLLFPGFLVFFMTFFEFGILQRAQVITLSIAGIFKELLTIVVSSFIFGDRLTFMNFIGLVITLTDIVWYNYYRYQIRLKEEGKRPTKRLNEDDVELEAV